MKITLQNARSRIIAKLMFSVVLAGCGEVEPDPNDPSLVGCSWGSAGETGDTDGGGLVESPGFKRYIEEHVVEAGDGRHWIIEGDIVVDDFRRVVRAYSRFHGENDETKVRFRGTVACDDELEIDEILDPHRKLELTYCFDDSWDEVPAYETQAIAALRTASSVWESAADINFIELGENQSCSKDSAYFIVEYEGDSCLFGIICGIRAKAFFPYDTDRTLQLWENAFLDGPATFDRVITHELGHVLGLWHEHARFPQTEGTLCDASSIDDGDGRGVTVADVDSVMGYPDCDQTNPLPTHPSALDRTTVSYLYNLPRSIIGGASGPTDSGTSSGTALLASMSSTNPRASRTNQYNSPPPPAVTTSAVRRDLAHTGSLSCIGTRARST